MKKKMSKAQICPVCTGDGKILKSFKAGITTMKKKEETCHGCGGRGWVTVGD